jgi:hypothetical protein
MRVTRASARRPAIGSLWPTDSAGFHEVVGSKSVPTGPDVWANRPRLAEASRGRLPYL